MSRSQQQHRSRRKPNAIDRLVTTFVAAALALVASRWDQVSAEQQHLQRRRFEGFVNSPVRCSSRSLRSRGNCCASRACPPSPTSRGGIGTVKSSVRRAIGEMTMGDISRGEAWGHRYQRWRYSRDAATGTTAVSRSQSLRRDVPREASSVGALKAMSVLLHDEPISFGGRQPFMSHAVRWFIRRRILSVARTSSKLNVEVEARSNREAMKGRFDTVSVDFQELIFDDIQMTGGAKFELLGVDLLTLGLLPGPMRRLRRLRRPCEVSGTSEFTDTDLAYSPAIRRLAQRIVDHALKPRKPRRRRARVRPWGPVGSGWNGRGKNNHTGMREDTAIGVDSNADIGGGTGGDSRDDSEGVAEQQEQEQEQEQQQQQQQQQRVHVFRVRVHRSRLAVEGEMTNGGPFLRVPFRYDFSLKASRDGHVVHLKDPSVYWGTPGGHVPLPMLPLQSFNIDLGDRARIEQLRISKGRLKVGGRFILSPVAPLMVSRGFKRGNIQHDLAETLSGSICDLLRFRRE